MSMVRRSKANTKVLLFIILIFCLILFVNQTSLTIKNPTETILENSQKILPSDMSANKDILYIIHGPIDIDSDDDFLAYGFNGTGTANDPYIIENYEINGGIDIRFVSKCFIIRNCLLKSSSIGIYLYNVSINEAIIQNVYCENNTYGIWFKNVDGVTITNSTIYRSSTCGITFTLCYHCSVYNSRIIESDIGIECDCSSYCHFISNLFYYNPTHGIRIVNHNFYLSRPPRYDNVFYNIFHRNGQSVDQGNYNNWYNATSQKGNYWSDWGWESYYVINSNTGAVDYCPLKPEETPDLDYDGIADGWELYYDLDPFSDDSSQDLDEDGLTNLEEFNLLTNPNNGDTDGDGINDSAEVNSYNTDPNKADTDDDGLNDYEEIFTYQTDPNNPDTDEDGKNDHWEVMNGFDPLSYDYLFIKNSALRFMVYISPFVFIFIISTTYFVIKRRKNTRKLIEYCQEQKEQLIFLREVIVESNQKSTVNVNEIAELIFAFSQVIISNTNLNNKPKKLYRLMRKNWSRKFFNKQGIDTLLLEIFEGFVVSSEMFDYSAIQTPIEKSEKMIEDTQDPDMAFRTLDEVKSVIKKNLQMVEQMNTIFNFHSVYLSPIEEKFTKRILDIKNVFSIYESQISKLESSKTDSEFKFKEIERIKTIEKVLQHETRVSMDKMIVSLDFQTTEELERWLLDNFSSVPYAIEENDIVFKTKEDKTEIMEAIDSLLKEYETWTEEGMGKKK